MQNFNMQSVTKKLLGLNALFGKLGITKNAKAAQGANTFFNSLILNLKTLDVEKNVATQPLLKNSFFPVQNIAIKNNTAEQADFIPVAENLGIGFTKDLRFLNKDFTLDASLKNLPQKSVSQVETAVLKDGIKLNKNNKKISAVVDVEPGFKSFIKQLNILSQNEPAKNAVLKKLLNEPAEVQKIVYTLLKEISGLTNQPGLEMEKGAKGEKTISSNKNISGPSAGMLAANGGKGKDSVSRESKIVFPKKGTAISTKVFVGPQSPKNIILLEVKNNSVRVTAQDGLKEPVKKASIYLKKLVRKDFDPAIGTLPQKTKSLENKMGMIDTKAEKVLVGPSAKTTIVGQKENTAKIITSDQVKNSTVKNTQPEVNQLSTGPQKISKTLPGELIKSKIGEEAIFKFKDSAQSQIGLEGVKKQVLNPVKNTAPELIINDLNQSAQVPLKNKVATLQGKKNINPAIKADVVENKIIFTKPNLNLPKGKMTNPVENILDKVLPETNTALNIKDGSPRKAEIDFNVNKNLKFKFVFTEEIPQPKQRIKAMATRLKRIVGAGEENTQINKVSLNEVLKNGGAPIINKVVSTSNPENVLSVSSQIINNIIMPEQKKSIKNPVMGKNKKIETESIQKVIDENERPVRQSKKGIKSLSKEAPLKSAASQNNLTESFGAQVNVAQQLQENSTSSSLDPTKKTLSSKPVLEDVLTNLHTQQSKIVTGITPKMIAPIKYISGIINKYYDTLNQAFTQSQVLVETSEMGKLDIRLNKSSSRQAIMIFVENDTIKTEMARLIPHLVENLQAKGVNISAVNIDVGQTWDKNSKQQEKKNGSKQKYIQNTEAGNEQDTAINSKRFYGYNTMDIIA
jgi:hypothetical protein